jgi:hypothetical protein
LRGRSGKLSEPCSGKTALDFVESHEIKIAELRNLE